MLHKNQQIYEFIIFLLLFNKYYKLFIIFLFLLMQLSIKTFKIFYLLALLFRITHHFTFLTLFLLLANILLVQEKERMYMLEENNKNKVNIKK